MFIKIQMAFFCEQPAYTFGSLAHYYLVVFFQQFAEVSLYILKIKYHLIYIGYTHFLQFKSFVFHFLRLFCVGFFFNFMCANLSHFILFLYGCVFKFLFKKFFLISRSLIYFFVIFYYISFVFAYGQPILPASMKKSILCPSEL